jgi:hypothetical protein
VETTRRDFLAAAAALPVVVGFPFPTSAQDGEPEGLAAALAKLKADGRQGLVVRLPKDGDQRCKLGHLLADQLNSQHPLARETLAVVGILCLEEAAVRARFGADAAKHEALLIDADGRFLEGRSSFKEYRSLVEGADGARFRERAEAARTKADAAARDLVARVATEEDVRALTAKSGDLLPWLASERRREPESERGKRIERAIGAWYERLPEEEVGVRLPYGIELAEGVGGCGSCGCEEAPPQRVVLACGIGFIARRVRSFVRFLRKE